MGLRGCVPTSVPYKIFCWEENQGSQGILTKLGVRGPSHEEVVQVVPANLHAFP